MNYHFIAMAHQDHFYSSLPFTTAIDRLKHSRVQGVKITVKTRDPDTVTFRLDLLSPTRFKLTMVSAHLSGTIRHVQGGRIYVDYHTRALSHLATVLLPVLGIVLSIVFWLIFPPEMIVVSAIPAIAGMLFLLFWGMLQDNVNDDDQARLVELIGRMLEKETTMAVWTG